LPSPPSGSIKRDMDAAASARKPDGRISPLRRVLWFGMAGGAGFIVDAGLLMLLIAAGAGPRFGRLVSFVAALVTTWLINRSRTFADRAGPPSLAEFGRYAAASSVAALLNLLVYMALVTWVEDFRQWPVLALAVATALSMSVNFLSYLSLVFATGR
jgi:putative flippase GtrA